jgi:hypothetical protein
LGKEGMAATSVPTTDSDRWTGSHEDGDDRWRNQCCLCLFFPRASEMALALASMLLIAFVGFWVVSDGLQSYFRAIGQPSWLEVIRQTRNTVVFQVEGRDKAGRRGVFDIVVLKKQFLWVRGSSNELERDGEVIPIAATAKPLLDAEVRQSLKSAVDIIAVGTASEEGTPSVEVARAKRRARKTARLVYPIIKQQGTPIWTLNLGQYRTQCERCEETKTSWQRPFIVIGVVQKQPDLNLAEALEDAMSGRTRLPSPSAYSNFDLRRFL